MNLLRTMPLQLLMPYLYSNLYSLHNMPPEVRHALYLLKNVQ